MPFKYWSMATEIGAIELHNRKQVEVPQDKRPPDTKLPPDLYSTANHQFDVADAKAIQEKATWPTQTPQSALEVFSSMIYLAMIDAKSTWDEASIGWRSVFYHRGMIIYHVATRLYLFVSGSSWQTFGHSLESQGVLTQAVHNERVCCRHKLQCR